MERLLKDRQNYAKELAEVDELADSFLDSLEAITDFIIAEKKRLKKGLKIVKEQANISFQLWQLCLKYDLEYNSDKYTELYEKHINRAESLNCQEKSIKDRIKLLKRIQNL